MCRPGKILKTYMHTHTECKMDNVQKNYFILPEMYEDHSQAVNAILYLV
jgi:hypothetical protein